MSQTLSSHDKQCDSGDSASTDYTWVTGPGASQQMMTQQMVIQNNDAVSQTITLKLQRYSGGYSTLLDKDYTITAAASLFPAEFMGQCLNGDASNPDKITIAFGTTLTGADTIDCVASAVTFA